MVGGDDHCEIHQWWYEKGDYCPECKGAKDERERIIELLENKQLEMTLPDGTVYIEFRVLHDIINAIKGENE